MPRFLANENIPRLAIEALRAQGHDVAWVAEVQPGAGDELIAARAQQEQRLILTFDKDFGDLILRRQVARPAGVVFCRFRTQSPQRIAAMLTDVLQRSLRWEGYFAVIEEADVRFLPLP